MDIQSLFYALGLSGMFASRAFLPAFVTSLILRYQADFPFIGDLPFVGTISDAPSWFTHGYVVTALGVMSLVELTADKYPESSEILGYVNKFAKPVMAGLTYAGVISLGDLSFLQGTLQIAGFGQWVIAVGLVGLVAALSYLKDGMLSALRMGDEDDDLGLQKLISYFEDLWGGLGPIIILVYPLMIGCTVLAFFGVLVLLEKRAVRKEEQSKVACGACGTLRYKSAVSCPRCPEPNPNVHEVSFWGTTGRDIVQDVAAHAAVLASKKRCPRCATRLEKRAVDQSCLSCGEVVFGDAEFRDVYLSRVAWRLPTVLLFSALLGLIPVLGMIMGIIYYRIMLTAPFKRYLTWSQGWFTRIFLKLLFFVLILLQLVPFTGVVILPLMALLSYGSYRRQFTKNLRSKGLLA